MTTRRIQLCDSYCKGAWYCYLVCLGLPLVMFVGLIVMAIVVGLT